MRHCQVAVNELQTFSNTLRTTFISLGLARKFCVVSFWRSVCVCVFFFLFLLYSLDRNAPKKSSFYLHFCLKFNPVCTFALSKVELTLDPIEQWFCVFFFFVVFHSVLASTQSESMNKFCSFNCSQLVLTWKKKTNNSWWSEWDYKFMCQHQTNERYLKHSPFFILLSWFM